MAKKKPSEHDQNLARVLDKLEVVSARLENIAYFLSRIVEPLPCHDPVLLSEQQTTEIEIPTWKYLVTRPYSWRRQPYVKGRKLTVRNVAGVMTANEMTAEETAEDLNIPVEAVEECIRYAEQNAELLNLETALENYLLAGKGYSRGAPTVSG